MNPGVWQKYYFSYRLILPSLVILKAQQNRGLQAYPPARITHIALFENTPQDLRTNLNRTTFFRRARIARAMVSLIADGVQSREVHQIRYRPRQSWRAGNSASPRTPPIPEPKRSCAFLKTHQNPCFKNFRPMTPGTWPPPLR